MVFVLKIVIGIVIYREYFILILIIFIYSNIYIYICILIYLLYVFYLKSSLKPLGLNLLLNTNCGFSEGKIRNDPHRRLSGLHFCGRTQSARQSMKIVIIFKLINCFDIILYL